ncbi:MAG: acyl-protein synthetase LuxE [Bacteroidetes bacterium HLUCCA01]|nr:MAG: acyl-protein synthetase LuxE [Bacteroidetes bacterium HLUCCA01]
MLEKFVSIFTTENTFESDLREILKWQWSQNPVYRRFSENIGYDAASLTGMRAAEVPLLPVEAFRDTRLYAAGDHPPELYFQSSGTTGMVRSRHEVAYENVYRQAIMQGIQQFYPIENMVVLGYTPGYNDNPDSSLIWMINELIRHDTTGLSAFLPVGQPITAGLLAAIEDTEKSVLLFGAAFGLVDLAERHPVLLPQGSIIMETGGMKTFRREMSRTAMHQILADGFGIPLEAVHSEYGMTELLSQCYAQGDSWFVSPPWVQVSIRNPFNPLETLPYGEQGLIGIIDLANWASCPFLLTGDRGVQRADGAFQVLGRWSKYHLRGCNFLLEDEL